MLNELAHLGYGLDDAPDGIDPTGHLRSRRPHRRPDPSKGRMGNLQQCKRLGPFHPSAQMSYFIVPLEPFQGVRERVELGRKGRSAPDLGKGGFGGDDRSGWRVVNDCADGEDQDVEP